MCDKAIDCQTAWCRKCANPSSSSSTAKTSRDIVETAKKTILSHCGVSEKSYTVLFTSGATESNCTVIRSVVQAYWRLTKRKPTIIVSSIEHESIMACAESLIADEMADVIYISPNIEGSIPIAALDEALNSAKNIALVSIIFANNELGTINNIAEIGAICHRHKVPLMTDATQIFGKYALNVARLNIDVLTASYHKFYGPKGLGLVLIKNELIEGYELNGIINGKQQKGLRAGTENVPAIAAGHTALIEAFKSRERKNQNMLSLRAYLINELRKQMPQGIYAEYVKTSLTDEVDVYPITFDPASEGFGDAAEFAPSSKTIKHMEPLEFLILGPPEEKTKRYLPNTLLIAIVKNKPDKHGAFCNVRLKQDLDKMKCVVSIGSTCNSSNEKRSHVLNAIRCPENVGRGVFRVSLGDHTTKTELDYFVESLMKSINRQVEQKKPTTMSKKTQSAKAIKKTTTVQPPMKKAPPNKTDKK